MILALLFAGLAFATRVPYRTLFAFNWDAANFALGVQAFDVRLHQPHPPGYPYFVGAGALLSAGTHEPHAALVIVSMLLECLAAAALCLLARAMFRSTWAAISVTLALVFSVTFWTYGEVALAYPALAAFSCLTALFVYQTRFEDKPYLPYAAAAYAVGSGFRPDLALFLLPLLAFGAWRQPRGQVLLSAGIAVGGVLLWLLPVMALSGGPAGYLSTFASYAATDVVDRYAPSANGLPSLVVNARDTAQYLGYALYCFAVVPAGGVFLLWRRPVGAALQPYLMLALWAVPMLLFYVLVHIGDPGYVFGVLPALLLAGAGGWRALAGPTPSETMQTLLGSGVALALLGNVMLFVAYDKPLTLSGLRVHDNQTRARLQFVQSLNPDTTMVVSYDSFKHFKLYAPQFQHNAWLDPVNGGRQVLPVPDGVTTVVFTDTPVFNLLQTLPADADYLPADTWAGRMTVRPGQSLVYQNGRLRLEG